MFAYSDNFVAPTDVVTVAAAPATVMRDWSYTLRVGGNGHTLTVYLSQKAFDSLADQFSALKLAQTIEEAPSGS